MRRRLRVQRLVRLFTAQSEQRRGGARSANRSATCHGNWHRSGRVSRMARRLGEFRPPASTGDHATRHGQLSAEGTGQSEVGEGTATSTAQEAENGGQGDKAPGEARSTALAAACASCAAFWTPRSSEVAPWHRTSSGSARQQQPRSPPPRHPRHAPSLYAVSTAVGRDTFRASARSSSSPTSPSSSAMGGCTGVGQHVGQARGQFSVVHFSSLLMRSSASPLLPGVAVSGGVGGGKGSSRGTRLHGAGAKRRRRKLGRKIPSGLRRGKAPRCPLEGASAPG
jgi:hypothetical protein